ncbi:hypothetical protein B7755_023790 [Streptomyces sp. NBS 14/10]|uniref:hypothetical protein n=1 Tax=Streptomyces sp. NBS 14/10 TaxID=1945643 RepID=UPI001181087A|nr:hypothetical protein [Streptomyces sp. NBS 14/10]KAK1180901.1 hypothetical protein B7755_023790 [Streptomyces sp. NBS 14/10]
MLGFYGLPVVVNSPTAEKAPAPATPSVPVETTSPSPSASSGTPSPSARTSKPTKKPSDVFKSLTLEIAEDYGISLDDDPMRPVSRDYDKELYWYDGALYVGEGAQMVVLHRQESGTYQTCSTVTRFEDYVNIPLGKGDRFCLISPTGLVALVENVGGDGPYDAYVTLKLTIWNGSY